MSDEEVAPSATAGTGPARRARTAPTIYDVAKLAGVAPSTVSRALSTPGRINFRTEEKIQVAARELNYRPNPMARALPTGRSRTLGLLVADITNPTFFTAIRGAERAASAEGYTVILAESQESDLREAEAVERIAPSVDGLVLVGSRLSDEEIVGLAESVPLVVINRRVKGIDDVVPVVGPGIDDALAHLSSLGHVSLAYLSGPTTSWMSTARWNHLLAAAPRYGMTVVEIGPNSPTVEGGAEIVPSLAASGVTAVLAYNDLVAIGAMRELRKIGLRVPEDLSIVGFDDIFGSDFTSPPLSTIRTPLGLMGERAVQRLLGVDGASTRNDDDLMTEFVARGSTGRPPADSA